MKLEFNLATIIIGIAGYAFGGWTLILQTLLLFMAFDYITGVIAALFKKSNKSKSGKLSSKAGFKGLAKKIVILMICSLSYRLDLLLNAEGLLYNMVLLFYISNEIISILENAVAIDKIPIPNKLRAIVENMKEEANES